jgi:hypothetical protein
VRSLGKLFLSFRCKFVCFWRNSPQWARISSFARFLDHTQRRTTVARTPLDEWSARRRGLYLTIHTTLDNEEALAHWSCCAMAKEKHCSCIYICVCVCVCVCVCIFGLAIRHVNRIFYVLVYHVACLAVPYFSTLSHKRHEFSRKRLLNIKCVFDFLDCFRLQRVSL